MIFKSRHTERPQKNFFGVRSVLYVTLIELLIVMAILSLAGGAIAIGISRAMVDQKFRTEVSRFVDELRFAQDLMLVLRTDVRLYVKEEEKDILYWLELETPIQDSLKKQVLEKRKLKVIRGFVFEDKFQPSKEKGQVDIKFLSRGMAMSRGMVGLATSSDGKDLENTLQVYIPLTGSPGPIQSYDQQEKAQKVLDRLEDPTFIRAFTDDTFAKLPIKKKKKEAPQDPQDPQGSFPKNDSSPPSGNR